MNEPTAPPSPDDLRDFLRSSAPPGAVQFEVPPELAAELPQLGGEAELPPTRINVPLDPTYDPGQPTAASLMYWVMQLPNLGKIEVTDMEKTLYLKSVDNDAAVTCEITLPMGPTKVEIRTRSVFEERAVLSALDTAAYIRKEFNDPAAVATRAQQLMGAVQLLAVNDKPLPLLDLAPAKGDILEAAKLIEEHAAKVINSMTGPRWNALLTALRIFEVKIKLCNDNANNETFWKPAS